MNFARKFRSGLFLLIATLFFVVQTGVAQLQHVVSAAALDNGVTINVLNNDGSNLVDTNAVSFEEGANAFEILDEIANIQYEETQYGPFITGINDVVPESSDYWGFFINGIEAPVGAATYEVQNGDNLLFKIVSWPPTTIEVLVSAVDLEGNFVIPETSVEIVEGSTAYDALVQAAQKHNLKLDVSVDSQWFTYVSDINNTLNGANAFWSTSINDDLMQVGLVSYQVQDGDHLELVATSLDDNINDDNSSNEEENEDGSEQEQNNNDIQDNTSITKEELASTINKAADYLVENNFYDWYTIIAFNQLNKNVPDEKIQEVIESIENNEGYHRNVTETAKWILILTSAGKDATNIAGFNLIDSLTNHERMTIQGNNGPIYSLLALDSGNYTVDEDAQWTREILVKTILNAQLDNGAWPLFGTLPNFDITAVAIAALSPYADQENVNEAINKGVDWLSTIYLNDGGYNDPFSGGEASETISQVIVGLTANHEDPTSEKFMLQDKNLVTHLLSYKNDDGGFAHLIEDVKSNVIATAQALLALVSYEKYLNNEGSVFQFNNKPSDNKEPSDNEVPIEEEPAEDEEPVDDEEPSDNEEPADSDNSGNDENIADDEDSTDDENSVDDKDSTDNEKTNEDENNTDGGKSSEQEDPANNDRKESNSSVITVKPNVQNNELTINDNQALEQLKDNGTLVVETKETSAILPLNAEEIQILKAKNAVIEVKNDDISVQIPASILPSGQAKIEFNKFANYEHAVSAVYEFHIYDENGKKVTQFNEPVTLQFVVNTDDTDNLNVYYYDEAKGQWELVPGATYEDGVVSVQTDHFSIFTVSNIDLTKVSADEKGPKDGLTLPNTATNQYEFLLFGAVLLITASILYVYQRKKLVD